jgi:hypothetical protein
VASIPPVDQWADWSYAESESDEELSPEEILNQKVLAILRASLIHKKEIQPDDKT